MDYMNSEVDLDAVMKQAHQLRAEAMAELFTHMSKTLSNIFVSELRLTRESTLARLKTA